MGFSKTVLIWIISYLQHRQLQVRTRTSCFDINLGVPQGSVLGPLLFCLYINDIKSHLNPEISYILYADDLQIYIQTCPKSIKEAISKLTSAAREIIQWATNVSLRLNAKKTTAIYFDTSKSVNELNKMDDLGIDMGDNVIIPFVNQIKSLGVILDNKLTWEAHITSI